MNNRINIFWFRRDLRLHDNTGLFHALKEGIPVLPVFIFDKNIIDQIDNRSDRRVTFIYHQLEKINEELKKYNSSLNIFHDTPSIIFENLFSTFNVKTVFTNHDYEPYAVSRDADINLLCSKSGIAFKSFKDQVIFEKDEVVKDDGTPYTIYTPYSKKWKQKLTGEKIIVNDTKQYFHNFYQQNFNFPKLFDIGFKENSSYITEPSIDKKTIDSYHISRDFPYPGNTTHISIHLRFGTISIRELVLMAVMQNEKYLNELIWREFLMQVLWHFPHVTSAPFKKKYEFINWKNNEKDFEKWCIGETGFPLVDAGMRELNTTGWMHNRVRMVVANFLTKILLVDWQWGESYFAEKLNDFELSSNNGNWQWAAGCGCDAAPYFRIFNPFTQTERFDPEHKYIKKWIPEFNTSKYLLPMIDFNKARQESLKTYKTALS